MADDYISKETFIAAVLEETASESVEELRDYVATKNQYLDWAGGVLTAVQIAEELPAADVRPVVKARWEGETGYIFSERTERLYCPVCGSFSYFGTLTRRNFCPGCGADMREGTK